MRGLVDDRSGRVRAGVRGTARGAVLRAVCAVLLAVSATAAGAPPALSGSGSTAASTASAASLAGPSAVSEGTSGATSRVTSAAVAAASGAGSSRGASSWADSSWAASSRAASEVTSRVIPVPASVAAGRGAYRIDAETRVSVDGGSAPVRQVGDYAAGLLRPATGYPLPVEERVPGAARPADPQGIVLALGATDDTIGDEGYRLRTTPRAVLVSARTPAGLFHGVQTLRQLLPAAIDRPAPVSGVTWTVPSADITDAPRYAYRGAMLDVARHFLTVAQVERYIDQLALYKINTLHLHLTDDQGWRVAVGSWPRLAGYGGSTEVGGGLGGWYTQGDYREIVRYAASRFLTVVPEIDGPGHTNAALASYAELNCDGVAPPLYTGTSVGFSSLCVPMARTYDFLSDVIREIAALTPGPYVHIGGDEAHSTAQADYATFTDKVQRIVASHGKTVIGWHQIDAAHPVPGALAQYWGTAGNEAQVVNAAKAGTQVIMSPANKAYLDMKYDAATPLGLHWAGYVEVEDAYAWDPATFITGMPPAAIRGVEAPLWTETLKTSAQLEYMAFPRLPGIAEIGWSPAATHDWNAYRVRLAAQAPRWTALGIAFHRSPQVAWPAA